MKIVSDIFMNKKRLIRGAFAVSILVIAGFVCSYFLNHRLIPANGVKTIKVYKISNIKSEKNVLLTEFNKVEQIERIIKELNKATKIDGKIDIASPKTLLSISYKDAVKGIYIWPGEEGSNGMIMFADDNLYTGYSLGAAQAKALRGLISGLQ